MGWAPKQARPGDQIAIMLGNETPTLIRPVPAEAEQYEVVGPCYLQGFMFGEGFLGPLPEGVRPVLHRDDHGSSYFKFLDTLLGESYTRDPRSDANASSHPDRSWAWQKGQSRRLIVEVEDLRSAGLDIRYFGLV